MCDLFVAPYMIGKRPTSTDTFHQKVVVVFDELFFFSHRKYIIKFDIITLYMSSVVCRIFSNEGESLSLWEIHTSFFGLV